jgi:hypothetical protein
MESPVSIGVGVFPLDIWRVILHHTIQTFFEIAYYNDGGLSARGKCIRYHSVKEAFHHRVGHFQRSRYSIGDNEMRYMYMGDYLDRLSLIHPKISKLIQQNLRPSLTGRKDDFLLYPFYQESKNE